MARRSCALAGRTMRARKTQMIGLLSPRRHALKGILLTLAGLVALGAMLPDALAQRPGQLSSARGKRWFTKQAPERTEGLISGRVESRKASRRALRQRAIEEARGGSSEPQEAQAQDGASSGNRTTEAPQPGQSSRNIRNPSTGSVAPSASGSGTKIKRRSAGRRGGGSGMSGKRRRSLLSPLFGG